MIFITFARRQRLEIDFRWPESEKNKFTRPKAQPIIIGL